MSSFPKDGPGSPHHRLVFSRTVIDSESGKRIRQTKTLYFRKSEWTKAKILDIKRELDYKFKIGEYDPWQSDSPIAGHQDITIEMAIDKYLKDRRRSISSKTLANYSLSLSHFTKVVGEERPLSTIGIQQVKAFIGRDLKYRSRLTYRAHLNAFFQWAAKKGLHAGVGPIAIESTRAERKEKNKHYLTLSELELLCAEVDTWDAEVKLDPLSAKHHSSENRRQLKTMFRILFFTGMRPSDLMHMKASWISNDLKYIKIGDVSYRPKSQNSTETVPVHKEIEKDLVQLMELSNDRKPVFGHHRLEYVSKMFKMLVRRCLPDKAAGLSLYRLRDSAVMFYTDQVGLQLHIVKDLLRHADVNVTEIYRHHKRPDELYELINR